MVFSFFRDYGLTSFNRPYLPKIIIFARPHLIHWFQWVCASFSPILFLNVVDIGNIKKKIVLAGRVWVFTLKAGLVFLQHFPSSLQPDGKCFLSPSALNVLNQKLFTSTIILSLMNLTSGKGAYWTTGSWQAGLRGSVCLVVVNLFTFVRVPSMSSTRSWRSGLLTFLGIMMFDVLFQMSSLRLQKTSLAWRGFQINRERAPSISDTSRKFCLLCKKVRFWLGMVCRLMLAQFSLQFQKAISIIIQILQILFPLPTPPARPDQRTGNREVIKISVKFEQSNNLEMLEPIERKRRQFGEQVGEAELLIQKQIDRLINEQLYAYIGRMVGEGCVEVNLSDQTEANMATFVMELIQNYNQAYDYFTGLIQNQQRQAQAQAAQHQQQLTKTICEFQHKLHLLTHQHEQRLAEQADQHHSTLLSLTAHHQSSLGEMALQLQASQTTITNLTQELSRKASVVDQYAGKLSRLQHQMEKYEYQLQDKANLIATFEEQLQLALNESQQAWTRMKAYEDQMLAMFEQNVWVHSQNYDQYAVYLQRSRELIAIIDTHIQINTDAAGVGEPKQKVQDLCPQQERDLEEWWPDCAALMQLKNSNKLAQSSVNKLIQSHKQQVIKYQNLSHKYAQFLKETENKFQECKTKINDLETENVKLKEQDSHLKSQLSGKESQTKRLLDLLKTNLESHKESNANLQNKVRVLEHQLQTKSATIESLEASQKTEKERMDQYIQSLTLEIQSLKESISTLKNVVRVDKNEPQRPIDTVIVQQMIDKTYEIRLENAKLKDYVDQIKVQFGEQCEISGRLSKEKGDLHKQVEEMGMVTERLKEQIERLQKQILHNNEVEKVLKLEIQSQKQQYEVKQSQLQSQLRRQSQEVAKLTKQLSKSQEHEGELLQKIQILQCSQQSNKKIVEMWGENVLCYQRMEIQQLQIFVLNSIVTNMRDDISKLHVPSTTHSQEVQVDLNRTLEQAEIDQDNQCSAETMRNNTSIRNRSGTSVGCLVNVRRNHKDNSLQKQNQSKTDNSLQNLNKTCKIRSSAGEEGKSCTKNQIEELNDLINYMINYLKGYTRNGVRKQSWVASQGHDYLLRVQNPKNIKQKYGTFERVRTLMSKNEACRQLVKDYEKIANFYFSSISASQVDSLPTVGHWESFQKQKSEQAWSTQNKTKCKDSALYSK